MMICNNYDDEDLQEEEAGNKMTQKLMYIPRITQNSPNSNTTNSHCRHHLTAFPFSFTLWPVYSHSNSRELTLNNFHRVYEFHYLREILLVLGVFTDTLAAHLDSKVTQMEKELKLES